MSPKTIIISRTDSIGDVVLTLPMAGVLKKHYPNSKIIFLGKTYTKPVVALSKHVDDFINWDDLNKTQNPVEELKKYGADVFIHVFPNKQIAKLVKSANIPIRIGVLGRLPHLFTCNKKVFFSRKNSELHESQLNLKLLTPLGIKEEFSLDEMPIFYGFEKITPLPIELENLIDKNRTNIILHPKSKGSAKEWGLNNYLILAEMLPKDKFKVFISGTKEEGELIGDVFPFDNENIVTLIGKLSLTEFISFIAKTEGLVAASTGPLHIASALGKKAIGLYAPKRPIHPGRWMPVGQHAHALVFDPNCENCAKGQDCNCIQKIKSEDVVKLLLV